MLLASVSDGCPAGAVVVMVDIHLLPDVVHGGVDLTNSWFCFLVEYLDTVIAHYTLLNHANYAFSMQVISYWAVAALGVLQVHAQDIQSGLGKYFVKKPPLDTPWTSEVGTRPWPEYPRPQLRRHEWKNLNGIWRYMDARGNDAFTGMVPTWENLDQEVLVPSCLESGLSG